MYISRRIAERITGIPLDKMADQWFYQPLGMQTTGYNPINKFDKSRIVPDRRR